jgi:hypothetical protein
LRRVCNPVAPSSSRSGPLRNRWRAQGDAVARRYGPIMPTFSLAMPAQRSDALDVGRAANTAPDRPRNTHRVSPATAACTPSKRAPRGGGPQIRPLAKRWRLRTYLTTATTATNSPKRAEPHEGSGGDATASADGGKETHKGWASLPLGC